MSDKTFVDTNVLIYAHDIDAGRKHDIAKIVLRQLWANRTGILSTQVLQEFYVNATRKIRTPLPKSAARSVVSTYAAWCVDGITTADVTAAFQIEDDANINFWDALIVAVAARNGAARGPEPWPGDCRRHDSEPFRSRLTPLAGFTEPKLEDGRDRARVRIDLVEAPVFFSVV